MCRGMFECPKCGGRNGMMVPGEKHYCIVNIEDEDKEKLASAISNMYEKLGEEKFRLVIKSVLTATNIQKERGEKIEGKYIKRILDSAIKMVNEI